MSGWIQLHRDLLNWEWYTDVNTSHLFIYCLLKANHTNKKWRGTEIKRGTFITSLETMSKETGLSVRQVRTALNKLKVTSELTSKTTNKNRLITITNYEKYQRDDKQPVSLMTSKRQASDKQVTTTNNDNNDNNDNNEKKNRELAPPPQKKSNRKIGSRLPEDWTLENEEYEPWGDWAIENCGWTVQEVIKVSKVFKDYWIAKTGKDATKLDWFATWRNWCRKQQEGF